MFQDKIQIEFLLSSHHFEDHKQSKNGVSRKFVVSTSTA
jgi:hypothetical protein